MGSRAGVGAKKERNISSIYIRFPHQYFARISVLAVCATLFVHKIRHLTFVQLN
jgi:hypothetical protein